MKHRIALGLTVALAALVGCSSDSDMADMGHDGDTTSTVAAPSGVNEADIRFALDMIPHHEQAVEMAQLAETRAERPEVVELAAEIEAAQAPEIERMQGWLEDWGQGGSTGGTGDHGGEMDMGAGMMGEAEMTELEGASGAAFDERFLTMMIEHHEGAIDQAEAELADGESPEAKELAQAIVDTQQAEIETMRALLDAAR